MSPSRKWSAVYFDRLLAVLDEPEPEPEPAPQLATAAKRSRRN